MRRSIEEAQKRLELDPHAAIGYIVLAAGYTYLDRYGEAESTLRQGSERGLETPETMGSVTILLFCKVTQRRWSSRWPCLSEMLIQKTGFSITRPLRWLIPATCAKREPCHDVRPTWQNRRHTLERAALSETGAAVWEAFSGNASAAKKSAATALSTLQPA